MQMALCFVLLGPNDSEDRNERANRIFNEIRRCLAV